MEACSLISIQAHKYMECPIVLHFCMQELNSFLLFNTLQAAATVTANALWRIVYPFGSVRHLHTVPTGHACF